MELTREQRDRIQQLLEEELRSALRSAAVGGARPDDVAALVADRRRALAESGAGLPDDADDPVDDDGHGGGVAEQR